MAAEPLPGDASPRRYVRLRRGDDTAMLMLGPDQVENRLWLYLGRQLWYHGLPLPRIFGADLPAGRFLLEDMGSVRLDALRDDPKKSGARINAYRSAAVALADFHDRGLIAAGQVEAKNQPYNPAFVFRHEWGYFVTGLGLLGLADPPGPSCAREARYLAADAASGHKVLIHRDFQSRNLMLRGGRVHVLDWQGARKGPAAYDVASILFDPYVELEDVEREVFLETYFTCRREHPEPFKTRLRVLSVTRLMQAIGAYASLTMVHRRPAYKPYILTALTRLSVSMAHHDLDAYPLIRRLVDKAIRLYEAGRAS